jgi:hypothetical protein
MQNTRTADFTVINRCSIFLLEPRTDTALPWVEDRLPEDALTFGGGCRSRSQVHP